MPRPRRSNLSRQSRNSRRMQNTANDITREQRRDSMARIRAFQAPEQSEAARETARLAMQNHRASKRRQHIDNLRRTRIYSGDLNRATFRYDCSNDYSLHPSVCIGQMDVVCKYCGALKFSGDTSGLCCLNGKVKLQVLTPPPEPLYSLLCGETQESRHFLANIRKYNSCFQMTSFGADIIEEGGFNPTFKIQGQIHHRIRSLLPFRDTDNKFLQIYFMGNMEEQVDRRIGINAGMKRVIIQDLQYLLHEHHALVRLFKSALERMPNDAHKVVIKADKRPSPNIISNYKNNEWLSERAILAAKNKDVDDLNYIIQNKINGTMHSFKSIDCVTNEDEATNYPIDFLNSLDVPGLPPHNLRLKVGSVVIMLRNINQPKLCNGTRLVDSKLMNNVIYATIMIGKFKSEQVLIPRIPMIPTDMPFEFKRLQFAVRLAFAMTINKSQGQSLKVCGLNLENSCFSRGQLYVACSRVGRPSALFVFAPDNRTKNVVYHKVLQ